MQAMLCFAVAALVLVTPASAVRQLTLRRAVVTAAEKTIDGADDGKNPIRKVVTLLQNMAKKVAKEGEAEEELFKKFKCYCKTGSADLTTSIAESSTKVPALQSDIEEAESTSAKLKQDLKQHAADRTSAKQAMSEATSIREKENEAYVKEAGDLKGYVDALAKAIPAIESGMSGSALMQVNSAAAALRRAVAAENRLTDDDRQSVLSFLSGGTRSDGGYVPKSSEITGILKDMKENFESDLKAVEQKEAEATQLFDELIGAKSKEVETLSASIEKKTARVGEIDLEIVHMKNDLTATEAALIDDQQFLKDLDGDCKNKEGAWEERQRTRTEELAAIHETISILNDDDALDLFKKTLPSGASSAFVQTKKAGAEQAKLVQEILSALRSHTVAPTRLDVRLLEFALAGKKVDFSKVIKMIDDMVALLSQEQAADDEKQDYCRKQIDTAEDKAKTLSRDAADLETAMEERKGAIAQLTEEIKVLNAGVAELDRSVEDATIQRKKENEEFTQLMSSDSAAKELLTFAKNRLQKFYAPKLAAAASAPEADESLSFAQQHAVHHNSKRDAPEPAPQTWGAYQKKGSESGGVISMIDLLIRDLEKEMVSAEKEEEMSQKSYEELMNDAAKKRASDNKSLRIKESSKADSEQAMIQSEGDLAATRKSFMAVEKYKTQLHGECDWLMQNFDLRKTARAEESENLKAAKAVLSGADFSLVQKK